MALRKWLTQFVARQTQCLQFPGVLTLTLPRMCEWTQEAQLSGWKQVHCASSCGLPQSHTYRLQGLLGGPSWSCTTLSPWRWLHWSHLGATGSESETEVQHGVAGVLVLQTPL